MNLHEYQARELLVRYQIPVPQGAVVTDRSQARRVAQALGGELWVIKAQVHAGGRGKGGGVRLARSLEQVEDCVDAMLGTRLVTHQTGAEGLPVNQVLISAGADIEHELYFSLLVDRSHECIALVASAAGGVDIEEVATHHPEQIATQLIHPVAGIQAFHVRHLSAALNLSLVQTKELDRLVRQLYRAFGECDASLIEINPLIVQTNGSLLALDAKINLDGNALFRHPDLHALRDPEQEDPLEREASEHHLNYVALEGDIACMVNGAGLAMATMDLIKLHGGAPANFLDVGGSATAERVTTAFKLILSNQRVCAILVNIFGGIVRCDVIAEGIVNAVSEVGVAVPVVVRLEGTNVAQGKQILARSGLDIIAADDLNDAAKKVVKAAGAKP